jgi:hypothetical protein
VSSSLPHAVAMTKSTNAVPINRTTRD